MPKRIYRLIIAVAAAGLLVLSGCALDPMERLSEQIDSQEVNTREQAVLELANLRDERAIETLVEVLESDEDIFDMAGVALVKQGRETVTDKKPDPVLTMVAGVMTNVHLPVPNRARATWVLGEIGDREAIGALRAGAGALLASGLPCAEVRAQATIGLQKLGEKSVGTAYELPMGTFEGGPVEVLPSVEPVAVIVVEDEEDAADEAAKPAAKEGEKAAGEAADKAEGVASEKAAGEKAKEGADKPKEAAAKPAEEKKPAAEKAAQ